MPVFPGHYHHSHGESPLDLLCGLWDVGPSTLYRYMDKGRRQLADVFNLNEPSGTGILSLRQSVQVFLDQGPEPASGWPSWHRRQAQIASLEARACDALWHHWRGQDLPGALNTLRRHAPSAAGSDETDALVDLLLGVPGGPDAAFDLALCMAGIWRHRHDGARENEQLQRGLRLAHELGKPLLSGRAYAALGRFFENRDVDRAFACYNDSVQHLQQASTVAAEAQRGPATVEYATVLIHLAWLHLRRNDPKARSLLDLVEQLARSHPVA